MPLTSTPTIGVFDSGFGGLTVLRALLPLIPGARFLYLGDTARLPYGEKSHATIARYALSSAAFLRDHGAEMLVIACNTASALALDELQQALPIPVIGVIEPGVSAALAAAPAAPSDPNRPLSGPAPGAPRLASNPYESAAPPRPTVLILATSATVQSAAYTRACAARGLVAYEQACPLLVPLVEEGWTDHPVTAEVLRIYLHEALAAAPEATTLILGCTHYPLLRPMIDRTLALLHHPLHIIDSASATAQAAAALLPLSSSHAPATCLFYATDSTQKFQRLGSHFLGRPLPEVHLVDLGG